MSSMQEVAAAAVVVLVHWIVEIVVSMVEQIDCRHFSLGSDSQQLCDVELMHVLTHIELRDHKLKRVCRDIISLEFWSR